MDTLLNDASAAIRGGDNEQAKALLRQALALANQRKLKSVAGYIMVALCSLKRVQS